MFTGIVQGLCPVVQVVDESGLRRLELGLGELAAGIALGASVAVNGTCLTATAVDGGRVSFDVIRETLGQTNLGTLRVGDLVNVERSFRAGDEVGGHILSGHVSGIAEVCEIDSAPNALDLQFAVPEPLMKYLLHKGFVAFDGASLTLASVDRNRNRVRVSLIPETIARTTLGRVERGARVNLEVDAQTQAIVDTVERVLTDPEWRARIAGSLSPA